MSSQSGPPSTSLFPTGSSIRIRDGSFVQINNVTNPEVLKPLYDKVSPNAILNKGGRADAVRCYPGTREEVIARIEKWHRSNHLTGHPIFWLSGPAGAGKSAIVQTIAERCIENNVPMLNFFFFRADATRNNAGPLIATLLFQLFELYPVLKADVMGIVTHNPVILRQSMEDQFSVLIEKPLHAVRRKYGQGPPVVLVDGLDECSSEHGKAEQTSLLRILHGISTRADPAFIVLVASRNEAHLTMTFNEIGTSPDSIYLDESYRPFDDIRLFVSAEFSRVRGTHNLRSTLAADWPHLADINSICHKSSGQFVYAATVMRFIATSPNSPKRNLEIVLGLRPVEDWKSVQDILAVDKILNESDFQISRWPCTLQDMLAPSGYTTDDILSSLSEPPAIVQFNEETSRLTVFHASLGDFLCDKNRAGKFYIDTNELACEFALLHFKQAANSGSLDYCFQALSVITQPNQSLNESLMSPSVNTFKHDDYFNELVGNSARCIAVLIKLYRSQDPHLSKHITSEWKAWFASVEKAQAQKSKHANGSHNSKPALGQRVSCSPIS